MFTIDGELEDNKLLSIIQRLADDEEICKLVSDERMRCEQHKKNYSKLKTEFNKITHENRLLHSDYSNLQLQYNDLKDTSAKALKHMEKEISDLKCQLEYLHTKLPTKAQEIHTRNEIFLQNESTWGQRVVDLIREVEEFKTSEANLLSENQCLKSDLAMLKESTRQERTELSLVHEKKYEKLKENYNALQCQYDPKILDLEQIIVKQNVELEELRNSIASSNNQVRDLNSVLRLKEKELRDKKEEFYKCSSTFSSKEAQLSLELEKVEMILEDTNLKLDEEKKKCWDLTKMANAMKKDLVMLQDQHTELAINHEALTSDQKVKHAIEKASLQREIDYYTRISDERQNKMNHLNAELDGLKIKYEMRIKAIKEEMLMIRLENAKREIELDAKATQYETTLEEVKKDKKVEQDKEKKKLSLDDRSDSNKQRTLASLVTNTKNVATDIDEIENIEEKYASKQHKALKSEAKNSGNGLIRTNASKNYSPASISIEKCADSMDINPNEEIKSSLSKTDGKHAVPIHNVLKETESLKLKNNNPVSKEILKSKSKNISQDSTNKSINQVEHADPAQSKSNDIINSNDDLNKEKNEQSKHQAKSRINCATSDSLEKERNLQYDDSIERKSISSKASDKRTKSNQLSYDDLYERYTNLQSKHTQFSGILKRSPLSFDDKANL